MPRDHVPPPLLEHFQQPYQTMCWCGVIYRLDGTWEAFTSLDEDIVYPLISSTPNVVNPYLGAPWCVWDIPALTYKSLMGLDLTAQPVRLNTGDDQTDATVLAFNKRLLLRGAYDGAQYEIWRANYESITDGRDVRLSGRIGTTRVGPTQAAYTLKSWPSLTEQSFERKLGPLCDVGIFPGEAWGEGRCWNPTLQDGPRRNDWTANATIVSASSKHELRVNWSGNARSGETLPTEFINRLKEGDVEFKTDDSGGENGGVKRSIKSYEIVDSDTVDLVLHGECFFLPEAGDALWLVCGCDRSEGGCQLWENIANFQGFNMVPGAADAARRWQL